MCFVFSSSPEEGTDDDTDYYAYESFTGSPKQQRKRKLSSSDEKGMFEAGLCQVTYHSSYIHNLFTIKN
jgi:hypothetical protein